MLTGLLNSGTNPGVFTDLHNSELKRTVFRVIRWSSTACKNTPWFQRI